MRRIGEIIEGIFLLGVAAGVYLFVVLLPVIYWLSIIGGSLLLLRWLVVI